MDAIVTAGGMITEKDRLYVVQQGGYKALLDICGKPMIQWVLDALNAAQSVDNIIIVGLPKDAPVKSKKPVTFLPDRGDLMSNGEAGAEELCRLKPDTTHALYVCSDIPMLTAEMVDWMTKAVAETDHDFYYSVVERKVMEARFPTSKRTYQHLKDVEVCGGDIFGVRPAAASKENPLWRRIIESRKNPIKQVALIGLDLVFGILFRRFTLEDCVKIASKRLGFRGRVIILPFAEMGMDVDKPHQLELVRTELAKQSGA
jgi:GTP:adenosylcobinamide-phosphate guanylyltransferase